jgi:GNAT superfamily N-acetyltransferase
MSGTYWAKDRPREVMETALEHSVCFGVYRGREQVGLARAITDYSTFAYLADVFIAPEYRGRGLGKWLVRCILAHPRLKTMRRWMLLTEDAQGLYAANGFAVIQHPERFMERLRPYPQADRS